MNHNIFTRKLIYENVDAFITSKSQKLKLIIKLNLLNFVILYNSKLTCNLKTVH